MSFRKPRTVLRESIGAYVDGLWVEGAKTYFTITASVQPVVMGQDLDAMPEGRRLSDYVKFYTTTVLQVTEEAEGTQPDFIVHEGYCYEIVSVYSNQSHVINHMKYIAVKAMKFTTTADWVAGNITRP